MNHATPSPNRARRAPQLANDVRLLSAALRVVETATPMTKHDIAFYEKLSGGGEREARQLWRVRSAILFVDSQRWADALALRRYLVPSTRVEGRAYFVDLAAGSCGYHEDGEYHSCPDRTYNKKSGGCVHIEAAKRKEKQYV